MRLLFRLTIQQLDGVQDTQLNADGLLPVLMREAGFRDVRELETFLTPTGPIVIIQARRSEEHTTEIHSLMLITNAVSRLTKKISPNITTNTPLTTITPKTL